jgi:hypothetical protein
LGHSVIQPLAAETFISATQRNAPALATATAPIPDDFLLLCGFGPFSHPAVGFGNLYFGTATHRNAPHRQRQGQRQQFLTISCFCAGLGHSLLQPLAAETFISAPQRTAPQRTGNGNGHQFLAISCSCVGLWPFYASVRQVPVLGGSKP